MKKYTIGLTRSAGILFQLLTPDQQRTITDAAQNEPGGKYTIDSADDFATVYGTPLSFIRDHKKGEITIMTTEEAEVLEGVNGGASW